MIKTAIVQIPPVFMNLEESTSLADKLIREAASNGARVIAFPETWLTGYPVWIDNAPKAAVWDFPPAKELFVLMHENSVDIEGPEIKQLHNTAVENNVIVVLGANEKLGGTIYNSQIYLTPDPEQIIVHRKLVPTYTERMVYGRGDGSGLFPLESEFGVIGGLICWEHWMPAARMAMHSTNELIHIAQWPSVNDLHFMASRHYAFEGGTYVLACGTVLSKGDVIEGIKSHKKISDSVFELLESIEGNNSKLLQTGGSCVISPDTSLITDRVFNEKTIIYSDFETRDCTKSKLTLDVNGHYSRPDIFELEIDRRPLLNISQQTIVE